MNSTGLALGVAALAAGAMYALYSLFKAGVFSPLKVLEKQFGAMLLLHVNAQGPHSTAYKYFEQLKRIIIEEAKLASPASYCDHNLVGIFYDDPRTTPAAKLRFSIAFQAQTHGSKDMEGYEASLRSSLSVCKSGELKVGHLPESRCLAVQLPFHSAMSVINAVWRAHPLLIREARLRLGKQADELLAAGLLEVYHPRDHTMWVVLPLTKRTSMMPFNA